MYHETESERLCYNCRWCDCGRECRYFDKGRDRVQIPAEALRCPFFEARGPAARVARICDAIYTLAAAVEALQGGEQ